VVSRDLEIFYPENRYLNFYITSIDDDQPMGFVMLIRDVTETRKRTEEQLESERLNAFTLLAAGVAHELGNPLNSLTIHLQLLERRLKKMGAKISSSVSSSPPSAPHSRNFSACSCASCWRSACASYSRRSSRPK
jgi:nitrogen-specific signal transduction histidine kinase